MKKILFSLVAVAIVSTAAVGATGAYFSDEVNSPVNTFSTGTMTLTVNAQHPTATAVFNETNLAPGQTIPERTFVVANTGSINGDHLDLTVNLSGDTALAQYIQFPSSIANSLRFGVDQSGPQSVRLDVPGYTAGDLEYGIRNGFSPADYIYGPLGPANGMPTGVGGGMDRDMSGVVTLADLAAGKVRILPGTVNGGIAASSTGTLWMNAKVDPAMGNDMQGKSLQVEFVWTLHQDTSQY